jgi:hypothetical protein
MSPFFSMASVRRLQPMIEERVQAFLKRLSELKGSGVVLRMPVIVNAFSNGQFPRPAQGWKDFEMTIPRLLLTGMQM